MTTRIPLVNGTEDPQGYVEPLDPNADGVAANGFFFQATNGATSGDTTVRIIRDASGNMQFQDSFVTRTLSQLAGIGATGPAGAIGPIGPTGPTGSLQTAYNNGSTLGPQRININPTQGAINIQEPSGGVSGGILFRVDNPATPGGTAYFQVTPVGMQTLQVQARRLTLNGTPLGPSDFSLSRCGSGGSAGNGPQYGVTNISGDDSHGRFTVMSSVTGYTGNPTVTLNFRDPWSAAPYVQAKLTAPMNPTAASPTMSYQSSVIELTISPTNVSWQLNASPSARCYWTIEYLTVA